MVEVLPVPHGSRNVVRDDYYDVLKFFGVMLVIFSHVIHKWRGCDSPFVENFIVGMNMPLFFMLSGMFVKETIVGGLWAKFIRHMLTYIWPMFVLSLLFGAVAVFVGTTGSDKGWLGYAGRRFLFGGWFLWCLAICHALLFLIWRCSRSGCVRVVVLGSLFALMFFLDGIWHVKSVRNMLPYYCFGFFVLSRWALWKSNVIGCVSLLLFLGVVALEGDVWNSAQGMNFYLQPISAFQVGENPIMIVLFCFREGIGILGSIGFMWGVSCLCCYPQVFHAVAPLGSTTLGVYLVHEFLLDVVLAVYGASAGLCAVIVLTGCLFTSSHMIVWSSLKIRFAAQVLWGRVPVAFLRRLHNMV